MTYFISELRERGVSSEVLAWRRWREAMHVTQAEAAAMAGLYERTVLNMELGLSRPRASTLAKLRRLMARWVTPLAERRGSAPRRRNWRGQFA